MQSVETIISNAEQHECKQHHEKERNRSFDLRGLKRMTNRSRTNDDVHNSIGMCAVTIAILDTPQMQRLRGLKQLGVSEMTYMTTTHCRFEHSLGVAHLAEQVMLNIRKCQPLLNITDKDVLCVKIAGLCHDLGHGPFSHIYDGPFQRLRAEARKKGCWLGQEFPKEKVNEKSGALRRGWKHEDASLMMLDAMLAYLGLEIDDNNLDMPLKQIGDGINAKWFGICENLTNDYDRYNELKKLGKIYFNGTEDLPSYRVLHSRDWIFIKECIIGGPIPPKGKTIKEMENSNVIQNFVGRPDRFKEWMYDIVANRHNGLDVDKLDYLARDGRRAFSTAGEINPMFVEEARVAWGSCPRPLKCFRCKHNNKVTSTPTILRVEEDGTYGKNLHLMICYPTKVVEPAMKFFKNRFHNHQQLYTHKTSKAAELMVCDILVLADPYIPISTLNEGDGTELRKNKNTGGNASGNYVSISEAMTDPNAYLRLKDSVLDLISNSTSSDLLKARQLLRRLQSRKLYKHIDEINIASEDGVTIDDSYHNKLWEMPEDEIRQRIVKSASLVRKSKDESNQSNERQDFTSLHMDDIIIEKRAIHHGMGATNPVSCMRFLEKSQTTKLLETGPNLPLARKREDKEYWASMPRALLSRCIRVYCRTYGKEDLLKTCYYQFICHMQKMAANDPFLSYNKESIQETGNINRSIARPALLSQDSPLKASETLAMEFSIKRMFSGSIRNNDETDVQQKRSRRKLNLSTIDSP